MHPLAHSALIGGAVMVAIAASFALGRGPEPVHQLRDKPFQDAIWRDDVATLAMNSARIEAMNMPRIVQTEAIKPEPDPLLMVLSEPSPLPRRTKAAAVSGDICAKHNMRKVYYGSTWRCRK
jgi:hypothetical protein